MSEADSAVVDDAQGPPRILIVDDDPAVLLLMSETLSRAYPTVRL